MKKWDELTGVQQCRIIDFFIYIGSDQWWLDMLEDDPEWCENKLRTHGHDPSAMTIGEKICVLDSIEDDDDW